MIRIFVLLCLTLVVLHDVTEGVPARTCSSNGFVVRTFGNPSNKKADRDSVNVRFSCKYPALVNQKCGNFSITLTVGNQFKAITDSRGRYQVNSLRLFVKDIETGKMAKMWTNNKKVAQYLGRLGTTETEEITTFWTEQGSNQQDRLLPSDVFSIIERKENKALASNDYFEITYTVRDPSRVTTDEFFLIKNFTKSMFSRWNFKCKVGTAFNPLNHSVQLCGDDGTTEKNREHDIQPYIDVFLNHEIKQKRYSTCSRVVDYFKINCTDSTMRLKAINSCASIIENEDQYNCQHSWNREPMGTFLTCIKWVCNNCTLDEDCTELGKALYACPTVSDENLANELENRGCLKT